MKKVTIYSVDWNYNIDKDDKAAAAEAEVESASLPFLVMAESFLEAVNKVAGLKLKYFTVGNVKSLSQNTNLME